MTREVPPCNYRQKSQRNHAKSQHNHASSAHGTPPMVQLTMADEVPLDNDRPSHIDAYDAIAFAAMRMKAYYDTQHTQKFFRVGDFVFIQHSRSEIQKDRSTKGRPVSHHRTNWPPGIQTRASTPVAYSRRDLNRTPGTSNRSCNRPIRKA